MDGEGGNGRRRSRKLESQPSLEGFCGNYGGEGYRTRGSGRQKVGLRGRGESAYGKGQKRDL